MNDETPRVWIGTLGLYNSGRLIGKWFDATDCPTEVEEWKVDPGIAQQLVELDDFAMEHEVGEELWCFDHDNFGGLLEGECAPAQAQKVAEFIGEIVSNGFPLDAVAIYAAHTGEPVLDIDLDDFRCAFQGKHDSEKDFAGEWADNTNLFYVPAGRYEPPAEVPDDHPLRRHFDYESYAEELFSGDFWSERAPEGGIYVFITN